MIHDEFCNADLTLASSVAPYTERLWTLSHLSPTRRNPQHKRSLGDPRVGRDLVTRPTTAPTSHTSANPKPIKTVCPSHPSLAKTLGMQSQVGPNSPSFTRVQCQCHFATDLGRRGQGGVQHSCSTATASRTAHFETTACWMVGATQESAGQPAPEGDTHISPALETARVCLRECQSGRRLGILCQRLLSHI